MRNNKDFIFPKYNVKITHNEDKTKDVELESKVRKKFDGKYYLVNIRMVHRFDKTEELIEDFIQHFVIECYKWLILGQKTRIVKNTYETYKIKNFSECDENQESEEERMRKMNRI